VTTDELELTTEDEDDTTELLDTTLDEATEELLDVLEVLLVEELDLVLLLLVVLLVLLLFVVGLELEQATAAMAPVVVSAATRRAFRESIIFILCVLSERSEVRDSDITRPAQMFTIADARAGRSPADFPVASESGARLRASRHVERLHWTQEPHPPGLPPRKQGGRSVKSVAPSR